MIDTLQDLYNSEINFCLSSFWDGGFDWRLGDEMNGFKASGCSLTLDDALEDLASAALDHYPDSVFAVSKRA